MAKFRGPEECSWVCAPASPPTIRETPSPVVLSVCYTSRQAFEYVLTVTRIREDTPDRKARVAGVTECWVVLNFVLALGFG